MRVQSSIATASLVPLISLFLAPSLVSAQADKPQPRVIAPDEGYVVKLPTVERIQIKVGSISTGSSQFLVALGTFPPGTQTPTHLHEVDEEVVYVLRGEVTVTLDEKEYAVGPGGTVFVPPGVWMAIANRTKAEAVILGLLPRGEIEECSRLPEDADEAARKEAQALCKVRYR